MAGTLFIVAAGALGLFLAGQGRDRADAWSSIVALFVAIAALAATLLQIGAARR